MNNKYKEYLKSDKWKKKRDKILKRANHKCELCGSTKNLHIHHLTYDNVYNEKEEDLLCVCDICHSKLHNKDLTKKEPVFAKGGWCKMYKKDMQQVLMDLSNKPLAMKIWLYLWDYMKKDGTIAMPKQKDIANALGSTKESVSRAFKTLKDFEIIAKINNEWRYNPFLFGVTNQKDEDLREAQRVWENEIGCYMFDVKTKKLISKYSKRIEDENN